jgi:hypothetical protein
VLDRPLQQRLGHRARPGVEDPPALAVVARRAHAADPALADAAQPDVDLGAAGQLGEALEDLGDVDGRPVVDGSPPLTGVPVEAPVRDLPHDRHDVRVVRESEDDDGLAVGPPAQVDVGVAGGQFHPFQPIGRRAPVRSRC